MVTYIMDYSVHVHMYRLPGTDNNDVGTGTTSNIIAVQLLSFRKR